MAFPRFLMLKSNANNKYLCHSKGKLGFTYDHLEQGNNKSINHSRLRFEVEKSKTMDDLVHIKSCYNNKYWVRKSRESKCIAASGDEGEEDQSKWGCTLFKLIFVESAEVEDMWKIRVVHVSESSERCVGIHVTSEDVLQVEPAAAAAAANYWMSFSAVAQASIILPEYVTFMGSNDMYLTSDGETYLSILSFSATDNAASGVSQRVAAGATSTEQTSLIDSYYNRYWYLHIPISDGRLDVTDDLSKAGRFEAVKVDDKYTALKCKDNNLFARLRSDTIKAEMYVTATSIIKEAMLRVGEPVLSRTITDATYDLDDSRVYDNNSLEKFSDSRSNHTSVEQEGLFEVHYKTDQTSTWKNSTTVNIGITVKWSAGIPVIGDLGVDISYEHSQNWESGGEIVNSKEVIYTQGIKIPPGKKITLKVLAQKATCDVPYTCSVTDMMTNGTSRDYTLTGIYTGINEFKFDTDIIEEDL